MQSEQSNPSGGVPLERLPAMTLRTASLDCPRGVKSQDVV